jgi:hypothetical protein
MDNWKKLLPISLLIGLALIGLRVYFVIQERNAPVVVKKSAEAEGGYHVTEDDYVFLKQLHPESPKDLAELLGKTVWTQAADQLPYFAVSGKTVDYAHQVGVLRGAAPLAVVGIIQQVAPRSVVTRVPNGSKQVLLAYHLPNDSKTYATPFGYLNEGTWTFVADQSLFYDDPHQLYSWSPKTWSAIESHTAIPSMTEQQAGLALGQIMTSDGTTIGDRTVHFDNLGHPVDVTFVKNHATTVTPEAATAAR